MRNYFEGWYFKHQTCNDAIAFIPGRTNASAFIQIITAHSSFHVAYPLSQYKRNGIVQIGSNMFSKDGCQINIRSQEIHISGELSYTNCFAIKYDIMGPFRYIPMECRHGIISMRHDLCGSIQLNGKTMDFTKGIGYIESDRGISFPKSYLWLQWNSLFEKRSIMLSIARIPFLGMHFTGCIGIVYFEEKEYRFATYLGVRIRTYTRETIILEQATMRLEATIIKRDGQKLYAPQQGNMTRTIHECIACQARFRFMVGTDVLFDCVGDHASFEYV